MIIDTANLRVRAQAARACVWPTEVDHARLGKSATQFMEVATPDTLIELLDRLEGEPPAVLAPTYEATQARYKNQLRAFIEVVAGKPLSTYQSDLLEQLLSNAQAAQSATV